MVALWKHQERALAQFGEQNFLYAGMSSGKTVIALEWLSQWSGRRLVITPRAAMTVYVEDNEKFYGGALPIVVLNKGTSKKKADILDQSHESIIVVNYETARLLPLDDYQWNAVVLDECHKIGTRNSSVTLALTRMLEDVRHKLVMTGTPYHDGYEKLYPIFRFLDGYQPDNPNAHPRSRMFGHWDDFIGRYCRTRDMPNKGYVRVIEGYKNIPELEEKIAPYTTVIRTEDVIDLPELVTIRVTVQPSAAFKRLYKELADESVLVTEHGTIFAKNSLTKLLRLSQMTNSGELVDEWGDVVAVTDIKSRTDALEQLLDQLGGKPAVIFTRFQSDQRIVSNAVGKVTGIRPHLLNGQVDQTDEWRSGSRQILVANISAGAAGLRLERAAHVIFWSLGFSHSEYAQALARCRRHGQQAGTVYSYEIVTTGTVDEHVYNTLHNKARDMERLDDALTHRRVE